MSNPDLHHLPRLERSHYQAFAAVHWTMRIAPATPGWLDDRFHHEFREALVHAGVREKLVCPTYCLMPDHLHLMLLGLAVVNRLLAGEPLQKSAAFSRTQPHHRDQIIPANSCKVRQFSRRSWRALTGLIGGA